MELSFNELVNGLEGEVLTKGSIEFNELSTDTRKIQENNIFLALKGDNFNGNKYIKDAFDKGASIAIIDEVFIDVDDYRDKKTIIKVNNCNEALLSLAKFYREKLGVKVVGVTGSCGKTSTKDLVAAFLSEKYKVFKTKGNFNNHIGMPLMILQLDSTYDVAVLELGMSNLGEIHTLANCARPDIALITNIGLSHIENLKTRENILKAKLEITDFFTKDNTLIVNAESDYLNDLLPKEYTLLKTGLNEECDYYATDIIATNESTQFTVSHNGVNHKFTLNMIGAHNVLNALLAIAAANKLGVSYDEMEKGLNNIENTSMRLEFIKGDNITIINDCYNASPDSMKAAVDVLYNAEGKRKVAILGTMLELGEESKKAHKDVAEYARDKVDLLIVTGDYGEDYRAGYRSDTIEVYNTKQELINNLKNNILKEDVILVKASRGMKYEEIVNELRRIENDGIN